MVTHFFFSKKETIPCSDLDLFDQNNGVGLLMSLIDLESVPDVELLLLVGGNPIWASRSGDVLGYFPASNLLSGSGRAGDGEWTRDLGKHAFSERILELMSCLVST